MKNIRNIKREIWILQLLLMISATRCLPGNIAGAFVSFDTITSHSVLATVDVWCTWECPSRCNWEYQESRNNKTNYEWLDGGKVLIDIHTHIGVHNITNLKPETWYRIRPILLFENRDPIHILSAGLEVSTCPEYPRPVENLTMYSAGPDWIALSWMPPIAEHCRRHLFYDVCVTNPEGSRRCNDDMKEDYTLPRHTSMTFRCPARFVLRSCFTVREGLQPSTRYTIEVIVRDRNNQSRSVPKAVEASTILVTDTSMTFSPIIVRNVTNTSFVAHINMSCEPHCEVLDALWQIRIDNDSNVRYRENEWLRKKWVTIGEYPVTEEVKVNDLQPGTAYQVRAVLQGIGEESDNQDEIPLQNVTTCTSMIPPHVQNLTLEAKNYKTIGVRWRRADLACANTVYRIEWWILHSTYSSDMHVEGIGADFPCEDGTLQYYCANVTAVNGAMYYVTVGAYDDEGDFRESTGSYIQMPRQYRFTMGLGGWTLLVVGLLLLGLASVPLAVHMQRRCKAQSRSDPDDNSYAWRRSHIIVEPLPQLADDDFSINAVAEDNEDNAEADGDPGADADADAEGLLLPRNHRGNMKGKPLE